jgi:hypothetical protein
MALIQGPFLFTEHFKIKLIYLYMFLLYQNTANYIYPTLSESVTLTATPIYYLFRFIDETSKDDLFFISADLSTNTVRYNKFLITLSGSAYQNLTAGTISMNPDGRWRYEVYEQYSQTNLDLTGTTGVILETGYITLSGTNLSNVSTEYTGQTSSWNYYQPTQ